MLVLFLAIWREKSRVKMIATFCAPDFSIFLVKSQSSHFCNNMLLNFALKDDYADIILLQLRPDVEISETR